MKINQVIETKEGIFTFCGELSQQEHDTLIDAGFKLLFGLGMLPFRMEHVPKEELN